MVAKVRIALVLRAFLLGDRFAQPDEWALLWLIALAKDGAAVAFDNHRCLAVLASLLDSAWRSARRSGATSTASGS